MKNIFVEGIQGTGKSTLVTKLSERLKNYKIYREGDISPIELGWCSYIKKEEFEEILTKYPKVSDEINKMSIQEDNHVITAYTKILAENPEFYKEMESHEIYNARIPMKEFQEIILRRYQRYYSEGAIFECSLFQNSIETLMLFYEASDHVIMDFYEKLYRIWKEKEATLIYLEALSLEESTLWIKKERSDQNGSEMWFPLMMEYIKTSPYGIRHGYQTFDDMVLHFKRRSKLEKMLIDTYFSKHTIVLPAKEYDINELMDFLATR